MADPYFLLVPSEIAEIPERASRLLDFELGNERLDNVITMRTMFARLRCDPLATATWLMRISPDTAFIELARLVAQFTIDGEPCPAPGMVALAALRHSGRAVPQFDDPLILLGQWVKAHLRALVNRQ